MNFWERKYSEQEIRDYIEKYYEKLDWEFWFAISKCQTLSEEFIRDFQDYVDWWNISEFQIISESFIREFQDQVRWNCISGNQNLSEEFLIEFIEKVVIGDIHNWGLIYNKKITEEVKQRIINLKKVIDQ